MKDLAIIGLHEIFVAIGNADVRKKFIETLVEQGAAIATLIHPNAVIGEGVQIGIGSIVMAGAVLNPECKIGKGCIVNTCASVDHDCCIGAYVHISVGGGSEKIIYYRRRRLWQGSSMAG